MFHGTLTWLSLATLRSVVFLSLWTLACSDYHDWRPVADDHKGNCCGHPQLQPFRSFFPLAFLLPSPNYRSYIQPNEFSTFLSELPWVLGCFLPLYFPKNHPKTHGNSSSKTLINQGFQPFLYRFLSNRRLRGQPRVPTKNELNYKGINWHKKPNLSPIVWFMRIMCFPGAFRPSQKKIKK